MTVLLFYVALFVAAFFIVYFIRRQMTERHDFTSLKTVTFGDESAVKPDRAASVISVVVIFLIWGAFTGSSYVPLHVPGPFSGPTEFTYTAENASGDRDTAVVRVLVHEVGENPDAPEVDPSDGFATNDADTVAKWRNTLIRAVRNVPIIAAGGICDGVSMAAAFALGAEGVQMGTRMVSAAESPVHDGWKNAIVEAAETDTVFLRNEGGPALRALRTELTERFAAGEGNSMKGLGDGVQKVYFEGKVGEGVALTGEVAGRIESIKPVADILADTVREYKETIERLRAEVAD